MIMLSSTVMTTSSIPNALAVGDQFEYSISGSFFELVNGEEILNYKTDWSNIEICEPWHSFELKPRTLGIWLNKHWTKTYRLKVRPHNKN